MAADHRQGRQVQPGAGGGQPCGQRIAQFGQRAVQRHRRGRITLGVLQPRITHHIVQQGAHAGAGAGGQAQEVAGLFGQHRTMVFLDQPDKLRDGVERLPQVVGCNPHELEQAFVGHPELVGGAQEFAVALLQLAQGHGEVLAVGHRGLAQHIVGLFQPQLGPHPGLNDGRANRLGNEVGGALFQARLLETVVGEAGDHDHRQVGQGGRRLQRLQHLEAVETGHLGVQQQQVRRAVVDQAQRVGAVGGEPQMAQIAQGLAQRADHARIVVDDQDVRRRWPPAAGVLRRLRLIHAADSPCKSRAAAAKSRVSMRRPT